MIVSSIQWTPCPQNSLSNIFIPNLQTFCSRVQIDYGKDDEKITLFVKRFVYQDNSTQLRDNIATDPQFNAIPPAAPVSLLLVPGIFPGDTFSKVENPASTLVLKEKGNVDTFTFDIRGTGFSHRLGCQLSQAESPGSPGGVKIIEEELQACIEELGEGKEYFSADQASRDILRIISKLKSDDTPLLTGDIYLYGHSFSSLLVQRAIQIHELDWEKKFDNLKGIVLDSVFNVGDDENYGINRFTLEDVNKNFNKVGYQLLDSVCGANELCASHFIDPKTYKRITPSTFLEKVYNKIYVENTCEKFRAELNEIQFKELLGWLLNSFTLRELIPAFLYRLDRCNEIGNGDVETALHLVREWNRINSHIDYFPHPESPILLRNLLFNELLSGNETETDSLFLNHEISLLLSESKIWPHYTISPYFNKALKLPSKFDVLILSGELDPLSPYDQAKFLFRSLLDQRKDTDSRTNFVFFPQVQNYVLEHAIKKNDGDLCGVNILQQFVRGEKILDTSCANDLLRTNDFTGSSELNQIFYGTTDIWEGIYSKPGPTVNLYFFIGIESATLVLFTLLLLGSFYVIFVQTWKLKKLSKITNAVSESNDDLVQYESM